MNNQIFSCMVYSGGLTLSSKDKIDLRGGAKFFAKFPSISQNEGNDEMIMKIWCDQIKNQRLIIFKWYSCL